MEDGGSTTPTHFVEGNGERVTKFFLPPTWGSEGHRDTDTRETVGSPRSETRRGLLDEVSFRRNFPSRLPTTTSFLPTPFSLLSSVPVLQVLVNTDGRVHSQNSPGVDLRLVFLTSNVKDGSDSRASGVQVQTSRQSETLHDVLWGALPKPGESRETEGDGWGTERS